MDYQDFVADVASFQKVLSGIPEQVGHNENNAIYEAGLMYVCLRNIAMAASWVLCELPDFSRSSPFRLTKFDPCPISARDYQITMACRMAGQRGLVPPEGVTRAFVIDLFERLDPWVDKLHCCLQGNDRRGQQH
jgi:hypothetical protein